MTKPRQSRDGSTRAAGRRRFLRTFPAVVMAGAATSTEAQPPRPATGAGAATPDPTSPRVDRTMLDIGGRIAGLDFTDAEERQALRNVNGYLESYETLRQLEIGYDIAPAIAFRPWSATPPPPGRATPNAPLALSTTTRPAARRRQSRGASAGPPVTATPAIETLAFEPVTALAPLIASRQVSSVALTRMYLDRLKAYGERLACVVTLTEPLALAQAEAADRDLAGGRHRGPLHGLPWGAKDLFATKGIRTTWGAAPFEQQVIDLDATVVERLREAGAVLVAKLSMGSLAQGNVWFGGATKTPWNLERGSSGSSAGSAAATAAGLVAFSLGTETLGSIISPATACGVAGLRPTFGRVSRHGAMALSWTMDKVGPICRGVEDCAAVLNAIYGPDGHDLDVADVPFAWSPDVALASLRIGIVQADYEAPAASSGTGSSPPSPEQQAQAAAQREVLRAALDVLRQRGAALRPVSLPPISAAAIRFVLSAEAATAFDDLTRTRGIDRLTAQGPGDWPNTFRSARYIPAVEYLRAQRARTLLMRQMDALMREIDILITPTRSASLTITNLTGHPALVLPCGFVEGLPVGLMFTGRLYEEAALLRVGLAFERATDWHRRRPPLGTPAPA